MTLTTRDDSIPLLGDYLSFRRDRLEFWTDTGRLGPMTRVRFGTQEFWVVTDPDVAEHILLTEVKDYPRDRRLMRLNRGPGPELMFNTDDWEEWRWRRRLLTPAFHRKTIERFAGAFVAHAVRKAGELVERQSVDLQTELREMTMRLILATMFSVTGQTEVTTLQESFEKSSEVVSARASAPVPIPYWLPTPANLALVRLTRHRWETLAHLIRERRASGEQRGDLLDLLIFEQLEDDDREFTTRDLVGEMSGVVFAGHETTAETQTWLFWLLGANPAVEERLLDEIDAVLGDRDPTLADLDAMPFTNQVIEETMRLYPAVYLTIREADVDHTVAGHHIPAGTRLVINIRGLHRDPAAWENPEIFDPDRFDPSNTAQRHRFQYIPFLAGPKKCLGDQFAMLEMRLTVPTLLRRLRFDYAGARPPRALGGFTLKVDNGMPMRVSPRR